MLQSPMCISHPVTRGLLLAAGLLVGGSCSALAADDPTGDWKVEDGVAVVRVAECRGAMWGAVAWEKTPGGLDRNNPDQTKRSRPTLGMPLLLDMKPTPKGDRWAGQVYNAKDGKTYKSTIAVTSPDELEIEGCVLGILCGSQTWTRVGPPIPSSPSNLTSPALPTAPGATKAGATPATKSATSAGSAPATKPATKTAAPPKSVTPPPANAKAAAGSPAAAGTPDGDIGDICLLPGIAGLAH